MSESAAERKARLKALRESAEAQESVPAVQAGDLTAEVTPPTAPEPVLKFRNYLVKDDKAIEHTKIEAAKVPEVEDIVVDPQAAIGDDPEEVLINVAPKKANWELRRAIAPQLATLDRRTQEAMIKLMVQEQASGAV